MNELVENITRALVKNPDAVSCEALSIRAAWRFIRSRLPLKIWAR